MKLKDITEWSEHWSIPFLGLAPGDKPDDNPDYQNDHEYSRPDSGLEDISDHLTASQGHRKKQKYEECFIGILHCRWLRLPLYSSKRCMPGNRVPDYRFSLFFTGTI
jgi:hypothetical protein